MITREVFWNISLASQTLFYGLAAVSSIIFLVGAYRILRIWFSSWGEQRRRDVSSSARRAALDALVGRRIFRGDPFGGLAHFFIMWGWIFLFIGTSLLTVHHDIQGFLYGTVYLVYSLFLDVAGAFFIVGVLMAAYRRYVVRANSVHTMIDDTLLLALLFFIAVTGFLVEGLRLWSISHVGMEWSPVGDLVGEVIDGDPVRSRAYHSVVWWVHSISALALIAYIPYSKLFHMFSSPTHLYLSSAPPAILTVEERESLQGEFDRTEMVSFDACTKCNRCEVVCPSYAAQEPLSPRSLVLDMKKYEREKFGMERRFLGGDGAETSLESAVPKSEHWYCTTCLACVERCPVGINPAEIAREIRAAQVETGRGVPRTIRDVLNNVSRHGNPWEPRGPKRFAWQQALKVKDISAGDGAALCYFIGGLASSDERNQKVAAALVKVLGSAGVDFGILGKDEPYDGELIRRLGEDGLYESLVEGAYEVFKDFDVSDIVTTSPHVYHTINREYPTLAEKLKIESVPALRVRHHTTLIAELLRSGRLRLTRSVDRTVTYHDPCYLGRHNGVYDAPREILGAIPGLRLVEMKRSREDSFCCGGGGGRMWLESEVEHRISELRAREAGETGAAVLVTACPYCLSNLEDGVKVAGFGDRIEVKDVVELVADAIEPVSSEQ